MALATKSFKRSFPLALLAVAIAESAHAPLLGGALASVNPIINGKPVIVTAHLPKDPDQKAPVTWSAPPIADSNDPSTIRKKLNEFEGEQLYDPFKLLRSNPTVTQPEPTVTSPIDLLPGTGVVNPGVGGIGSSEEFPPVYPAHPTSVVNGGLELPTHPTGPTYNPTLATGDSDSLPPTTAVPEPATLSALVFGFGLLVRPVRRSK